MGRIARNITTLMKMGITVACVALVVLWPEWRVSLQGQGYENLPPLCGQTCSFLSNCNDPCNSECTFDVNNRTWSCEESTCGKAAICESPLPDECIGFCNDPSNCGQSCIGQSVVEICTACPDPDPESPPQPEPPQPEPPQPEPPQPEPPQPEPPQPPPSSDEALSNTYGVPLTADRNGLFFADSLFQGPRGAELRQAVSATAAEFGIDPGLLAITMAAEVRAGRGAVVETFTSTGPVQNQEIGLDYWHSDRIAVMRTVREARDIRSTELREHFINEEGRDTGPKHEFPNGPTALRAMAARLRYGEIRLSRDREVGLEAWNNLPTGTRFAIVRAYYNGGGVGLEMARRAAKGQNVLVTSGPVIDPVTKKVRPRRAATVRAGQAVHLSRAIFQNPVP